MTKNNTILVSLILGSLIGYGFRGTPDQEIITNEVVKEVVKNVEVVKEIEVCNDLGVWQELKEVDDEAISLAADVIELSSDNINAYFDLDLVRMEANAGKLDRLTTRIFKVRDERLEILRVLGY